MKKTFNGTFTIEYSSFMGIEYIAFISYQTTIGMSYYMNGDKQAVPSFFDNRYYSQTTRIHQGIARAILSQFDSVLARSIIWDKIKRARSLRDLKRIFGYVPTNY